MRGLATDRLYLGLSSRPRGTRIKTFKGKANIVSYTPDAIAFRRTPQEVLRIVYLTENKEVSNRGFYPTE